MKKILLLSFITCATMVNSQVNWQNFAGGPSSGFWDMDTLNGKLYVSTGMVNEFDGLNWTTLSNYNNSLNTPNKTKSAVKAISGKLYCGAKDFNTSGEGAVHYFDGANWTLMQNTNIPYHGNYKIRAFTSFNNEIYMSGNFRVPTATSYSNIAKWNGSDWIDVGRNFTYFSSTNEITDMEVFQNNLFITDKNNVWRYNGSTWDSLFNSTSYPTGGGINDMVVFNNELYMSGFFNLSSSNTNLLIVKYNGSAFSGVAKSTGASSVLASGTYTNVGRLSVVNNSLYFIAKKTSDNNTYLVSFDGTNFTELTQLASTGDWPFAPGYEYTNYTRIMVYNGSLIIGGNFQKIGGQSVSSLAYIPHSAIAGIKENNRTTFAVTLFPNPTHNRVRFTFSENIKVNLIIRNQLGQIVKETRGIESGEELDLNLKDGIYSYSLLDGPLILKSGKFVVQ